MFSIQDLVIPTIGGIILGISTGLMMWGSGKITGISGIFRAFIDFGMGIGEKAWRMTFLAGMVLGGLVMFQMMPENFVQIKGMPTGTVVIAGLLVGFGTRLGSGCTSGHGICGLARFSKRSLVAVLTFIATGAITVYLVNNVL